MNEPKVQSRFAALSHMIGNTPLLAIDFRFRGHRRTIFVKCEQMNLTDSIKDRMALYILRRAYESGTIKPGDTIAEATSGNTGIAFAALGRALGHPVKIFMPDWMSAERRQLMISYGALIAPRQSRSRRLPRLHSDGGGSRCTARPCFPAAAVFE